MAVKRVIDVKKQEKLSLQKCLQLVLSGIAHRLLRSGLTEKEVEAHIPFLGALLKNERDTEALDQYRARDGVLPNEWADLGPRYRQ